ncbi:hypothetical protein OWC53_00740 [Pectobacterium brasiliense]|uniref:hypothetical protein n=1 Tax=Pectobacterium brasiliense TaxID=180957 RepID=UPI00227B1365|nr:hypothetical protein [Pectobacterium brasiliense]WGL30318.1 hypothetical protein OWC53_00740 [Pectobacterium brasiliense]
MGKGVNGKAFPEKGREVSIHGRRRFEWSVSVLANTKLTTFTAVFYWFTLKRDEPFFMAFSGKSFKNNCMLSDYKQLQAVKMWPKMAGERMP